jgi:HTH-type transcriptional regulator, transcriptional repressor of NAD biosynthesis genes
MIRGLVIGKFMPVHQGHVALINFAATHCDEVIVSMSYCHNDAIDPQLRFAWLKEIFIDNKNIKIFIIEDNFDDESLSLPERTKIWSGVIKKNYPAFDLLFSSEIYGEPFAKNLTAKHISFDSSRKNYPVSGTLIRSKPFTYWNYIPEMVKPFFVKKICFFGPESTGKSTLSRRMAEIFSTCFVPEAPRELIQSNDFSVSDILKIGQTQHHYIQEQSKKANKVLFCDTDIITTQIYSSLYLNAIPDLLFELEKKTTYALYFLMDIDVPWVADPLRDLGDKRKTMLEIFKKELDKRKIQYVIISGDYAARENQIITMINALLEKY